MELSSHSYSGSEERLTESDKQLMNDQKTTFYVPVALVLQTEIENHDIFRQMLCELFESIRNPEQIANDSHEDNKKFAFADMLAHVAFLKTLPCPSFNTKLNITFFKK